MNLEENKAYSRQIEQWRSEREASLRKADGWLSLAGLFILEDGEYSIGSGDENRIVLPSSAPGQLGTLTFQQGVATLRISTEIPVLVAGTPVESVVLIDNSNGQLATVVTVDSVSFNLHKFGNEFALRVRDSASSAIQAFAGCVWYEIKPDYRVQGHLVRQSSPSPISVATSVKTLAEYQSIGAVEFELQGRALQLLASAASKASELFIILRDATAGHESYGAGRYLYAEIDSADNVILDFNKAYNPPCAFTPYATCSLPPAQNVLPLAIEAGELY